MADMQFLTIKEASDRYQKAEITIRRFVRNILKEENGAMREHLQPTPVEVDKLKKKSKPFTYSISEDLLMKHFGAAAEAGQKTKKGSKQEQSPDYVDLLKKTNDGLIEQMRVKDEQIRALNASLDDLGERQRETNVLMRGLQQQLLLGSGKPEVVETAQVKKMRRFWPFG